MTVSQRRQLLEARLTGLVRRFGSDLFSAGAGSPPELIPIEYPNGAAARIGDDPETGVVVISPDDAHGLWSVGDAAVIADRQGVDSVEIWLSGEPDAVAQVAADAEMVTTVGPVRHISTDGQLSVARPSDLAAEGGLPPAVLAWAERFEAAGLRPVVEGQRLAGLYLGLEMVRAVADAEADGVTVEVGVGKADRELTALVHEGLAPQDDIARALEMVKAERRAGSFHPLAQMARQRWLRDVAASDPAVIGATEVVELAPISGVDTVIPDEPAAALAEADDGGAIVVFSVGIDPKSVVVMARHARRYPEHRRIFVVPTADHYPLTDRLATAVGGTVRELAAPWLDPAGR